MPDERLIVPLLCGRWSVRAAEGHDERISDLASRQHGVVARRQLLALGLGRRAIEHRLSTGRLRSLFGGVYAVGHEALSFHGRVIAALLAGRRLDAEGTGTGAAAGKREAGAVASHLTAAALWSLTKPHSGPIHVSSPWDHSRRRDLVAHRAILPTSEVTVSDGIPLTTPTRTLLDLSAVVRPRFLRRVLKEAEFIGLVDSKALAAILCRYPRRRGRRALAEIVDARLVGAGRTRSDLEDDFLLFCRAHRLPLPETNALVEVRGSRYEIDAVWRRELIAIELDGYGAHRTRSAFEQDRARDRRLTAAGWAALRITWTQLLSDPATLAAELRDVLAVRRRQSGRDER